MLTRSLFVDKRGGELLEIIVARLHSGGLPAAKLRCLLHTSDGLTALHSLAPPFAHAVTALSAAGTVTDHVGVLTLDAADLPADELAKRRFVWQMDQALSHPAMLELRASTGAGSPTVFAVVLWESIRHICRK